MKLVHVRDVKVVHVLETILYRRVACQRRSFSVLRIFTTFKQHKEH